MMNNNGRESRNNGSSGIQTYSRELTHNSGNVMSFHEGQPFKTSEGE